MGPMEEKGWKDYPELIKEYARDTNDVDIEVLKVNSRKKVWWRCEKGHEWLATPKARTTTKRAKVCPYCSMYVLEKGFNDIETVYQEVRPDIVESYKLAEANEVGVQEVLAGGSKHHYWKCIDCGYVRKSTVRDRTQYGCPACRGLVVTDRNCLAITHPKIAKRWVYEENFPDTPYTVVGGVGKKYAFKCEYCGRVYWDTLGHQKSGRGCTECSKGLQTSRAEVYIYLVLKGVLQGEEVENRGKVRGYEYDIILPERQVVISYENDYHHKYFERVLKKDIEKEKVAKEEGLKYIRVIEDRTIENLKVEGLKIKWNPRGYGQERLAEMTKEVLKCIEEKGLEYKEPEGLLRSMEEMTRKNYKKETLKELVWLLPWWDTKKNQEIGLEPKYLVKGVHKYANWKCPCCGEEFKLRVDTFVYRRKGCKKCKTQIAKEQVKEVS